MNFVTNWLSRIRVKKLNDSLIKATMQNDFTTVKNLIVKGADVNAMTEDGLWSGSGSVLMIAAKNGNLSIVKELLAKGARVNVKNKQGSTALSYSSIYGHIPVVKALLDRGANINEKNGVCMTALMMASMSGQLAVVEALLALGADINAKSTDGGMTALWFATVKCHIEVVEALLARGADVNAKTKSGMTALQIASEKGHQKIVEQLIKADALGNIDKSHTIVLPAGLVSCDRCGANNKLKGSPLEGILRFSQSRCQNCRKTFCACEGCTGLITANMPCPHCGKVSSYVTEEYDWI